MVSQEKLRKESGTDAVKLGERTLRTALDKIETLQAGILCYRNPTMSNGHANSIFLSGCLVFNLYRYLPRAEAAAT